MIRLGSFYYAKNEEDSATIFFRKVTYYPVNEKTVTRISNAYNNLGVIAQNNDNYDLAKGWARKALKLRIEQNDIIGIVFSKVNLGNLYHFENQYSTAIDNYFEAYDKIKQDTSKNVQYLGKRLL